MIFIQITAFALIFVGLKVLVSAMANKQYSYVGHRRFAKMKRWNKTETDLWSLFPMPQLLRIASRIAYVDEVEAVTLQKQLTRAGLSDTPKEYTGKKYLLILLGTALSAICVLAKFYMGIILAVFVTVFLLLKLRDTIADKIKAKDLEISSEMPRFVRTICRNLQTDRDLVRVIASYRKVAGTVMGSELDILLAEMQSGNLQNALSHFENRIGTADAFRLCSALRDMAMGIDQTATLSYLADSMAVQAKENIRKELSLRPSKMRATFYPAIGVCVAMIMYVLIVYVINSLNSII
jgi:tight adherence protein C